MAADGAAGTQVKESAEQGLLRRQAKQQMGNGHLLYPYQAKRVAAELQLHSDQGAQYASQVYFELTQTYGITPSMSRRGNPYDNAMAENFFSKQNVFTATNRLPSHRPMS